MHAAEIGVAALREGTQQVQRRGRLPIGLDLAARIGRARGGGEVVAVDDIAAIAGQFDTAALFHRRGARLGELPGDAADFHDRQRGGKGQNHRHLQEHAEKIPDIVGAVLGEAFRTIAAMEQKCLAGRDAGEMFGQSPRLAGKYQRRKGGQLLLDLGQGRPVRIIRHLLDRLVAPGLRRPTFGHGFKLLKRGA